MNSNGCKRRAVRRITYAWTSPQIVKLIEAVQKRPAIWDIHCDEYKCKKSILWHELADELGIGISASDAKVKWFALRVTFRANLKKIENCKTGPPPKISWCHFQNMRFLINTYDKELASVEIRVPTPTRSPTSRRNSDSPQTIRRSANRPISPTDELFLGPSDITTPITESRKRARNAAFCDLLSKELDALSEYEAYMLRRTMHDHMLSHLQSIRFDRVRNLDYNMY